MPGRPDPLPRLLQADGASPPIGRRHLAGDRSSASGESSSTPVMPITPFMGVRISWLMVAGNALLASLAASAWARARASRIASSRRRWVARMLARERTQEHQREHHVGQRLHPEPGEPVDRHVHEQAGDDHERAVPARGPAAQAGQHRDDERLQPLRHRKNLVPSHSKPRQVGANDGTTSLGTVSSTPLRDNTSGVVGVHPRYSGGVGSSRRFGLPGYRK